MSTNRDVEEGFGLDELGAFPSDSNAKAEKSKAKSTQGQSRTRESDEGEEEPEGFGLDELDAQAPDENPDENAYYRRSSLEERRSEEQTTARRRSAEQRSSSGHRALSRRTVLNAAYVHSYLIFFSILGVLARIGLASLTTYPGAPLVTTVVWANVGGSLIMGFLREDRLLFRRHWNGAVQYVKKSRGQKEDSSVSHTDSNEEDSEEARKAYHSARGSIHGFIGLTVGFCGTFTSFADILRDALLAISNNLDAAAISDLVTTSAAKPRPAGYSVLAVIAVLWIEVSMSLAALKLGAHLAIGLYAFVKYMPKRSIEWYMNQAILILGPGCWIGTVIMAIFTPYRSWRGQAVFAIVFAPPGAILRFHLARQLNSRLASFPLGTFAANVFGTCVLGMVWDLQHSRVGAVMISCQVLQGIADGFCGALTTVSTWVLELDALRLRHAYVYAIASLGVCLTCMVTIMGSLRWTEGFDSVTCTA